MAIQKNRERLSYALLAYEAKQFATERAVITGRSHAVVAEYDGGELRYVVLAYSSLTRHLEAYTDRQPRFVMFATKEGSGWII